MSQESNDDDDGDVKDYCAAFLRLEPDIRDLVRAVNIVMLTVLDEDCNELTIVVSFPERLGTRHDLFNRKSRSQAGVGLTHTARGRPSARPAYREANGRWGR